jgi:hypothetical protein
MSTLLQVILNPSHHLLNVLLQLANKLGLQKKIVPTTLMFLKACTDCWDNKGEDLTATPTRVQTGRKTERMDS